MTDVREEGQNLEILTKKMRSTSRVPGLPIRDCARGCNNRGHTRSQISAKHVTENISFERLHLVPGMGTFGP